MEVLGLSRGILLHSNPADRPRVNHYSMQDLSVECDGDLLIVLAFAEKIGPDTYIITVLEDPQSRNVGCHQRVRGLVTQSL